MADDFGAQLLRFSEKTGAALEDVDVKFKFGVFNDVVMNTRVDTGRMRGNWQVTTGTPAVAETQEIQQAGGLRADEVAKIQPFSATYLTNNVSYVTIWEERDGMVGRAIANARQSLEKAVKDD